MAAMAVRLLLVMVLSLCLIARQERVQFAPGSWDVDLKKIEGAMRREIIQRLIQKIEAEKRGSAWNADYLTNQAYEKIKPGLLVQLELGRDPDAYLSNMCAAPASDAEAAEFLQLVEGFVSGMTIEIRDSLQIELDQIQKAAENLQRLQQRLERLPEAERTSEKVSVTAHACQVPLRLLRRAQAAEKKLGIPPTESDSFAVFAGLKKASGLGAAEMGQRVVFQLGDKYRAEYPFISEFLGCYRQRVDNLRAALRRLREILPEREGP